MTLAELGVSTVTEHATCRAIENGFPMGFVSRLAEHESWRKEVYRPIYYMHKWWARRLGSVFRAIILGSCAQESQHIEDLFYRPMRFPDVTVFDPFMGSGTTVGEAVKLGCRVIGRDINPVSVTMVRAALQAYSKKEIESTFDRISETAGAKIRSFYSFELPNGKKGDVLYYFWVKVVPCPSCGYRVELFKSRVFAQNASPKTHPEAKSICPVCRAINDVRYDAENAVCQSCKTTYDPTCGVVDDKKVTCPSCRAVFSVIEAVRQLSSPPQHKMYAKMVLCDGEEKLYLPADEKDEASYRATEELLDGLWENIPQVQIAPGHNTRQVLNYNYRYWHEMFNARQLVCLGLLASEIQRIQQPELRTLFACLLSSILEFNNMFCSFKGEGTGAVRPIFAHHILKPELAPLEANIWGTPKSSGSFSTLFQSRILRAVEYKSRPFEFRISETNGRPQNRKVFGLSDPVNRPVVRTYQEFASSKAVYLSCGDSSKTDMPDESVDLVITDPPFFDNVHYSELADFFYVWLRPILGPNDVTSLATTRSPREVQDTDAAEFASKLLSVFGECGRVLKQNGLFVFTYHHSRIEGWLALYQAIRESGFYVVHTHPVKSEMAVAIPIQQSKSPINFDLIVVCRKNVPGSFRPGYDRVPLGECISEVQDIIGELQAGSMRVSVADAKVILLGCVMSRLSLIGDLPQEIKFLQAMERQADSLAVEALGRVTGDVQCQRVVQLPLFPEPM